MDIKEYRKQYREQNKEKLKEYRKQYYELNKEKAREYNKKYSEQNKEKIKEYRKQNKEKAKEYSKKYYEQNKEKLNEINKQYREQNKEKLKEYKKQYYKQNKEKAKECVKKYREQNKEKIKERGKKYYEQNKEKAKEYSKKYYEQNKEKASELNKKYHNKYARACIVMLDDDSGNLLICKFETISKYLGASVNDLLRDLILSFYYGDFLGITALIASVKNQLDFNSVLNTKFEEIENKVFNNYKNKKKIKHIRIPIERNLYNDIFKRSHERFHSNFSKIARDLMKAFVTLDTNKFTEYVDLIVGTRKEVEE